jgi:hypothetical protein
MGDLRWALLLLGTVFLAGLGLWEWRRGRRSTTPPASAPPREVPPAVEIGNDTEPLYEDGPPQRREPVIGDLGATIGTLPALEVPLPGFAAEDSMRIGIASGAAVDIPAAASATTGTQIPEFDPGAPLDFPLEGPSEDTLAEAGRTTVEVAEVRRSRPEDTQVTTDVAPGPPPIRWPPSQLPDRVLGLRVAAPVGRPLAGQQVRLALQAAGLRHGPQQIFHRTDDDGNVLASVANLLRPGSLVPERMDGQEFRGLSLFTVLPGPRPDPELLEGLVMLARALAARLGATVQDEYGQELDAERLTQLRRAVATPSGDGAGA